MNTFSHLSPFLAVISGSLFSGTALCNDIVLPPPDKKGGKPLMQVLHERHSTRSFADKPIPVEVLPQGSYLYKPETHRLEKVVQGDMRAATGTQEFAATAPLNLVYVVDQSKQPGDFDARRKLVTACTDAGFIGENVYLFCTSEGLGTVFRAMINANYIQQCLKLPVLKKVLYAQSVGYPSES